MTKKYRVVQVNEKLYLLQKKNWLGWKTICDCSYKEIIEARFHELCPNIEYKKEQIILEN